MSFSLTSYIYPFEGELLLSDYLKISLDNPRTKEEVSIVEKYIKKSLLSSGTFPPYYDDESENRDFVSLDSIINRFIKNYSDETYIKNFFSKYSRDKVYEFIAKMWVIVRFDDEGSEEELKKDFESISPKDGYATLILLEDDHPLVRNENLLESYSYLLSLLVNTQGGEYMGNSFFIAKNDEIREGFPNKYIFNHFTMFAFGAYRRDQYDEDESKWLLFPAIKNEILEVAKKLEVLFSSSEKEKIEYISSLLRTAGTEIDNEKHKLVVLVSIIEMLLTHNPNFSRFNVEDSINKQFQLKASIVVYKNNSSIDINALQKRLRLIYAQRSNVAHGNFKDLNKYINGLCKQEGKEEYFEDLISDLYIYIRAIIEEYIKDPVYINFLKSS